MNIKYLTKREEKLGFPPIQEKEMIHFLNGLKEICIDSENSALDPYKAIPLLISIGNSKMQVVIDTTTIPISILNQIENLDKKLFIGHNIKYDHKIFLRNGFEMKKAYCTQIAEQTLRMGLSPKFDGGNSLEEVKERRINKQYEESKDTRKDFIGQDKRMEFKAKHIKYAAEDVVDLEAIKAVQMKFIEKYEHKWFLKNVEFKLMLDLAKTEMEGLILNVPAWQEIIKNNKIKKNDLIDSMDIELIKLNKQFPKLSQVKKGRRRFDRKRNREEVVYLDLFGEDKIRESKNNGNINYNSNEQVKQIFRDCGKSIPIKESGKDKGKETTGKDALINYIVDNPGNELKDFVYLFYDFQEVSKRLSSFGENYINAINPITKKIHTTYNQCGTATGRFSSGGGKVEQDKINSQQIPKDKEYRQCFGTDEGYNIMTIDLSGAELVILASLSGDNYLKTILDDPHSPLATGCYNDLIKYILNTFPENRWMEELVELLKTEERAKEAIENGEFIITKANAKDLRDAFKSVIYGLAYGASNKKIAFTLKISLDYADMVVEALRRQIPDVFAFLDNASKFGVRNGYIMLSERSKNRRWFKKILDAKRYGAQPEFGTKSAVERECKNSPIQGSQAAMIKEAAVYIYDFIRPLDAQILLFVHDELVIKYSKSYNKDTDIFAQNHPPEAKVHTKTAFGEKIKEILCNTCNQYLDGLTMDAEYEVLDTWTK